MSSEFCFVFKLTSFLSCFCTFPKTFCVPSRLTLIIYAAFPVPPCLSHSVYISPTPVCFAYFSPYCKTGSRCYAEKDTLAQLQLVISVLKGQNIVFLSFQVRFSAVDCFIFLTSDVLGVPDRRSQQY